MTTLRASERARGPASPAGLGARLAALVVDWLAAAAISAGFFAYDAAATLAIFFVMTTVLVATLGGTIGHRIFGLAVEAFGTGPPGFLRAAVRTAALCLVIPAVVWGPDGRALHDRWAGTRIVRRR